jgi:broad specificity phosphatase PhoE
MDCDRPRIINAWKSASLSKGFSMPVCLIRHGQSEFNAVYNDGDADPMTFDAPLTQKGVRQAEDARAAISDLGIRLVIASPLTRAIQTALCIFDGIAPIKILAEPRERLNHSCDVGRTSSELQTDFPGLSFDHLKDKWWHQGALNEAGIPVEPDDVFRKRIDFFKKDLRLISERPVAVVGHGDLFRELAGFEMANCEIRRFRD